MKSVKRRCRLSHEVSSAGKYERTTARKKGQRASRRATGSNRNFRHSSVSRRAYEVAMISAFPRRFSPGLSKTIPAIGLRAQAPQRLGKFDGAPHSQLSARPHLGIAIGVTTGMHRTMRIACSRFSERPVQYLHDARLLRHRHSSTFWLSSPSSFLQLLLAC